MKVKFFYDNKYEPVTILEVQENVNKFIEDKEVIDIKLTSEAASNGHSYMVMVMYQ